MPRNTNAGSMHNPVGSSSFTDRDADSCSIAVRSPSVHCSEAVVRGPIGETPRVHDGSNTPRRIAEVYA